MLEIQSDKINRVKSSFGKCCFHQAQNMIIDESDYEIDYSRTFYLFDVIPMGAVRMSQSDKWKTNPNHVDPKKREREAVTRYRHFKNVIRKQAEEMKFELKGVLEIVFLVPMPSTWSEKKKQRENKKPVKTRPDTDNYVKAFMDALSKEDGYVWKINSQKRYAFKGSILVYA